MEEGKITEEFRAPDQEGSGIGENRKEALSLWLFRFKESLGHPVTKSETPLLSVNEPLLTKGMTLTQIVKLWAK